MAMERYIQDSLSQNYLNKEDDDGLNKWKSSSESIDASENSPAGGFSCNICLDTVNDPVVTLCGHLYCWPCIYKWIHHQKNPPEHPKNVQCPVCKSEVSQKTLIPLYGRGQTAEPVSDEKDDISIPRRPASPRCNVPAQQVNHRPMTNMISPTSPTTGILGEIVYERIFGNSHSTLFTYPNSYNLAGISTQRARRQAMQADKSLSRICFFLLCCIILCLLLF
ncbi:E3 ubiquitin-protein ligase RMA1H1-like [Bidens hawaiensis]|uniref:E3 ubiquitin-protein ligase RMA1H1-like n=1 Tax=Bidens hawaiensis TaxID=980011 RepID=UPI004049142D